MVFLNFRRLLLVVVLMLAAGSLPGQVFVWTGATDGNWATAGNWDAGVPASGTTTSVVFDTATTLTTANNISGGLTLNQLTFGASAGARTVSGNALIFDGVSPTLVSNSTDSGDIRITAPITLNQTLKITGGPSADAQLLFNTGSGFSGTGGLIWAGGVGFNNAASSFSGPVQILDGVFGTSVSSGLGTATSATVASGGSLQLQSGANINKALSLAGAGFESHGALESASGSGTWSGAITLASNATVGAISNSTLTLSGGVGLGANTLTANVTSGSTVSLAFAGAVTGTGGITKTGAGTLTFSSNTSSYTGATLISAGVASVTNGNGFGLSSLVTVSPGAELRVAGVAVARPLSLAGTLSGSGGAWSGPITLAGNATLSANGGSVGIAGGLALNGATLTIAPNPGSSTNIVSLSSALTGNGALNVVTGLGSVVFAGGGMSSFTGPISINGNATLGVGDNFGNLSNVVTFTGNSLVNFNSNATIGARSWVMSGVGGLTLVPSNSSHTIGANISGDGPLTVTSIGSVALTGTNTFTGGLVVGPSSTVRVSADAGLGADGGAIRLAGGGLSFLSNFSISSARSIEITLANATISAVAGLTGTVASNLTGAGRLTIAGGAGGLIGGTIILAGTNSYSGGTLLSGATLALDSDARLGAASGFLNFSGVHQLLATGSFTIAATRSTTFTNLKVNTNGFDVTFAQALNGAGIEKNGAGVLRFDAANASTSNNVIVFSAGTMRAGVANAFGIGANFNTVAGTVFDLNGFNQSINGIAGDGDVTLGSGTLTMRSSANLGGVISGTGGVILEGGGSFLLNGTNTFSGGLTVRNAASLVVNSTAAFGAAGGSVTLDNGGIGTSTFATAPVVLDASVPLTIGAGGASFSASGQSLIVASTLTGTVPISVSGGGAGFEVRFSNASNTFVSNLQIGRRGSDAVLGVTANGSLGASTNVITLGDRFFDGESTQTSRGTLRAFASLTIPTSRPLQINGKGGAIDTNGFNVTIDTPISQLNPGVGLIKSGAGTLFLNGTNTFTGVVNVQGGTLGGTGTIAGNLTIGDATLAPGASAGLFTVGGNVTLGGGSLTLLELAGITRGASYDALNIGGAFTANGTLTVSLIEGFNPVSGNSFALFNAGSYSGTFAETNLPALTPGLSWNSDLLASSGMLSVTGSAIPEPGTYAFIAGCAGLVVALWRRRNRPSSQ